MFSLTTLTQLAFAASSLFATANAFDASSNNNVALYWGQASAGSQDSLASYCESDAADIMILSFMTAFPGTDSVPTLNFASACSETFSSGLLKCDQIAADIQTCQGLGKKVMLSMGGASGSYGFSSDSEAETFAGTLWDLFGEGSADERPFGDAVLDGFDFDIENNDDTGYAALATKLREYFAEGSKTYYLSAAPQCVYPDASIGDALTNAEFDFAFIQFYNNYCSIDGTFNWDTWVDYAENTSPNKDIKLYLGLPGSTSAAGSGYVDIDTIKSTLATIGSDSNFGGVMLWDASQSFTNTVDGETFAEAIKDALNDLSSTSDVATTAATSTTETSSTVAASTTKTSSTLTASSTKVSSTVTLSSTKASVTSLSTTTTADASTPTQATTSAAAPSSSTAATTTSVPTSSTKATTSAVSSQPAAASPSVVVERTTQISMFTSTVVVGKQASTASSASSSTKVVVVSSSVIKESSVTAPTSTSVADSPAPTSSASASPAPTASTQTTSSTFVEVTSNTFTAAASSTLKTVLVSTTTTSSSASTSTSTSSSGCDSLTGDDKASCLNAQYAAGQFAGSPDTCTNGVSACSSSGEYAICNWGTWVIQGCAAGTVCEATVSGDDVFVGCGWPQSSKHKRGVEHAHHEHEE